MLQGEGKKQPTFYMRRAPGFACKQQGKQIQTIVVFSQHCLALEEPASRRSNEGSEEESSTLLL